MSDPLGDAEIVQGLQRGERPAWDALCQRYNARVWRYVAHLVGPDEHRIADVFQETLLAVAKAGRKISDETPVWAWLSRIAHNQAALFWRTTYRMRAGELTADAHDFQPDHDPVSQLMQKETVVLVRSVLAEMNADRVAVLVGKYSEGQSIDELVTSLGGTTDAIRSRLARARTEFRDRFERLQLSPTENTDSQELSHHEGDPA